ncbi:sugar diacid recognition domain-containing protein [Gracilibacillus sp. YIM 98692]|uniref:CdaR family transcriptional regulator n=1 Tax=Gracilibacillus sp. YIM 98692 TaxID=2663532 RepID=UPI0013D274A0|nr:sugar diacid recognition domain-containing protein [Gracilibacillus sp. YIM 98692]
MIRSSLANSVISELTDVLDEDLIIVDVHGVIIASTESKRIDNFHEGAKQVIDYQLEQLIITEDDTRKWIGVKAGINLPIVFLGEIIGVIGITGNPDNVIIHGQLVKKMTELLIKENYDNEQLDWRSRTLEMLLQSWLKIDVDMKELHNQAKFLHINLTLHRRVVLLGYTQETSNWIQRRIWEDVYYQFFMSNDDLIVRWEKDKLLILFAYSNRRSDDSIIKLLNKIQEFIYEKYKLFAIVGIGNKKKPNEIYLSLKEAYIAYKETSTYKPIVFEKNLDLELYLREIQPETQKKVLERSLSSVIEDSDLLETLQVFLKCDLSYVTTAKELHVHVNTLHYRINKIETITGISMKKIRNVVLVYLCLSFLDDSTIMTQKKGSFFV